MAKNEKAPGTGSDTAIKQHKAIAMGKGATGKTLAGISGGQGRPSGMKQGTKGVPKKDR